MSTTPAGMPSLFDPTPTLTALPFVAPPPADDAILAPAFALSEQQDEAMDRIMRWLEGPKQEFRLGGYAGTGKTTIIKWLQHRLNGKVTNTAAAFTGKAVSVLRRKGVTRCGTLHSLLYVSEYDAARKRMVFKPRSVLAYDLVIVDEASMISTALYNDLKRHGVKLLFIGDPAQLEPVGDNPNLMREADFVLTQIHRQAEGNPILRLARALREGRLDLPLGEWHREQGSLVIVDKVYGLNLADYDVVICAKNLTRHGINARRRVQLGRGDNLLVPDERVICLKNDRETGVYNGLTTFVTRINGEKTLEEGDEAFVCDLTDEAEDEYFDVPVLKKFFGKDLKQSDGYIRGGVPFDYGYCLTGHKSQGSEWDDVLVYQESLYGTDMARWLYTAATRAARRLTIVRELLAA